MVSNERGFMYPLSHSMLILVTILISIHLHQFLAEKRLFQETETILKQEYYLLCAVKKLEAELQTNPTISNGTYLFKEGIVVFTKEDLGTTSKFTMTLTLANGIQALGFSYYDKNLLKMVKWVERK
jgi:competence protein ComGG